MRKSVLIILLACLLVVSTINAAGNSQAVGLENTLRTGFFFLLGVLVLLTFVLLKKSRNSKEYLDPRAYTYYHYPKR